MKRYVYNSETLSYEEKEVPFYLGVLRVLGGAVVAFALAAFWCWIYVGVLKLDTPKLAFMKKESARWNSHIGMVNRQLDLYEKTLHGIEERDNDVYRAIFGLDTIAVAKNGNHPSVLSKLETMQSRTVLRSESLDSIAKLASQAGDMAFHVPAVPPVCPAKGTFRITSAFGHRSDPIRGTPAFHSGMDFAARVGLPVYATADGIVESVKYQFTGYGNEILVNHGFGYKTRYAHLKLISVTQGTKIQRGDYIGTVGRSGKATGPHLHYEVIYKGKPVNPYTYMDMDMSVAEYRAMIKKRQEDADMVSRRSTTTELLRRHR